MYNVNIVSSFLGLFSENLENLLSTDFQSCGKLLDQNFANVYQGMVINNIIGCTKCQ